MGNVREISLENHRWATSRSLSAIAVRLRRKIRLAKRFSGRMVELDIARCRIERDIAAEWVKCRNAINKELDKLGMTEAEWCQKALGCSIQTMRRRMHLLKGWSQYLKRRREVGDNGQYGLLYAASLASPASQAAFAADTFRNERSRINNLHFASVGRQQPQPCCQLITGDAKTELPKLPARSVNVIVCSPPYWPPKRAYGKDRALGFEETLPDYIRNLVDIFREARRVLRDDGSFGSVVDDCIHAPTHSVWPTGELWQAVKAGLGDADGNQYAKQRRGPTVWQPHVHTRTPRHVDAG